MKKFTSKLYLSLTILFALSSTFVSSQVDITATTGTASGSYSTLKAAFDAINAGTHQGDIVIGISANTSETAPAVLNSTGAGSAVYTSVLIQPTVDGVTISGATATGRGLIELNGADNVTINGDNPNTAGLNRNLTISNTAANTVTYTSVVRLATTSSTVVSSCDNFTIRNSNLLGNATAKLSGTSTTGAENTVFGLLIAGKGGTTATTAPSAITSVSNAANAMVTGTTSNSILIDNCSFNSCARGIAMLGFSAASCNNFTVTNNQIGSNVTPSPSTPPYTSPTSTIYTKGVIVQGVTSLTVSGNTFQNILTNVGTATNAIELTSAVGATGGSIVISNNTITSIHNYASSAVNAILFSSSSVPFTISGNTISDIQTTGTSNATGISISSSAVSGTISNNKISTIYARNTGGYASRGILISSGSNFLISNNLLWDLLASNNNSNTSTTYAVKGIALSGGTGHQVYHNTISLSGSLFGTNTAADNTTCLMISGTGITGVDIRNNIFSNTISAATAAANACLQLPSGASSAMNLTLNNNAYYTGTASNHYAVILQSTFSSYLASNFSANSISPALNFRSYTSTLSASGTNDNTSIASTNAAPFISATNLHIDVANAGLAALYQTGASGTGVTNDIDNDSRAVNPCIGADEFNIPACSGTPTFATTTITPNTAQCLTGNFSMSASPLNLASGYAYQWQSSSSSLGPWSDISGANGMNYSAANVTNTTYYQCVLTCTASSQSVTSSLLTATINPLPMITIVAANNGYFCGTAGQTLTASGANTYTWSPSASLDASTGTVVTSNVSTPTTYTVTGTDLNGCVNTQQITVGPPTISITSTTANFCGTGGNSTLNATSTVDPDMSYSWSALTPSATISSSTGSSATVSLTETSDFKVTGIGSGAFTGCTSEAFISIGVYPLPSATVTTTASGVCPGTSATIGSGLSAGNFSSQSIPHTPLVAPTNAVTLVSAGVATPATNISSGLDDAGWANIPVGFNFNFFGASYNTISIGTNGTVFFGGSPNVSDFSFTTLPSVSEPFNMIAVLAMDNNLGSADGGAVKYWTTGYAPNRKFVVSYEAVKEFGDAQYSTAQAIFYETTGVIEVHVTSSTNIDRNKLVGVNNGDGTVGVLAYTSGTAASATNPISSPFAYRFTPPSNYTTVWTAIDSNGTTTIASGNNIFSQSVAPLITTTYSISYTNQTTGCTNAPGSAQVLMSVLGNTAPNEITALTNTPSVCSGSAISLSTDYTGSTDGLVLQWQVSTDNGVNFTDITGANALTYAGTQTLASVYQLKITACGGTPAYSSSVSISMNPYQDCYCIPTISTGCTDGDVIARVILNTLDNNSGTGCPSGVGGNGYSNYTSNTALTTTLLPSSTYNCTVYAGQYSANYAAWIDYNDDGIFDNLTERIGYTTSSVSGSGSVGVLGSSASFPIVLACNPPAGQHRLRVREEFSTSGINITPCGSASYGEVEDYLITIATAPTCPAPGQLSVATTNTTSADLSWTMGCSSASNFDFEFGPTGFTQGTGTLVSNVAATINAGVGTYSLTGLTPNTSYSVYFRANCGLGDTSPWSISTDLTTACAPITLSNPGNQVACDSYTLPTITEVTPSGNSGLVLEYRTQANGGGTVITASTITSSQTVYIHATAGTCSDNQSFTVTINHSNTGIASITACDSYTWINGVTYTSSNNTATHTLTNAAGCDSVVTLNLTINHSNTGVATVTACDSYTWIDGITYTASNNTATHTLTNAAGCDSVVTLNLTINHSNTGISTITACDSYTWIDGITYTASNNSATHTLTNAAGCDSVVTLNLTINHSNTGIATISACDTYTWIDGVTYTSSNNTATHTLTNTSGCDSVVTLNLTINHSNTGIATITACDTYTWIDGVTYTTSNNTATHTLTNAAGCDSVVTLNLTINHSNTGIATITACETYTWIDGITYTASNNTATFTLTNVSGCDSVVTLNLTIEDGIADGTNISTCSSYTWNGQTYTQSGTYYYTGTGNCAVTDTLYLTILNNTGTDIQTACDSYTWIDGITYTTSNNTATFNLTNVAGCDSLVTLNLTINHSSTSSSNASACGSYTWNGQTYTQSGTYIYSTSNANGCDSTATLNLTINAYPTATATYNATNGSVSASQGNTYQWIDCSTNTPISGATSQVYSTTENGDYAVIVTNASGCSDTSNCVTVDYWGLKELNSLIVKVYPNPSFGIYNVVVEGGKNVELNITDASGRIVKSVSFDDTVKVDLSNVLSGVYYFQMITNDTTKVIRVVKN